MLKEFMKEGKERLTRDTVHDTTRNEVEQIHRENRGLKLLLGNLSLELHRVKRPSHPSTTVAPARERRRPSASGG